jgi:hypothetical protein
MSLTVYSAAITLRTTKFNIQQYYMLLTLCLFVFKRVAEMRKATTSFVMSICPYA